MGKFLAVITPYILICNGYQIFRDPPESSKPYLIPLYIFLTSVLLLLYDLRLYPKRLRNLGKLQTIIELLVAAFLMEHLLIDFWIPLDATTRGMFIKITDKIEDASKDFDSPNLDTVFEVLRCSVLDTFVSYSLGIFFLLSVLHAIRAVDFRALEEGPSCFFGDILYRSKRFLKKKLKSLGIARHKRVKFDKAEVVSEKYEKSNTKYADELSLKDFRDFPNEDLDAAEGLDDDDDIQFSDFDIPVETELLCDTL